MRAGVHQVVTFAAEPFRGNPAFVVSLESKVPDSVLQQLAAQLREPVLASLRSLGEGRTELLFHTPEGSHTGAGHAMLAAAHIVLAGDGAGDSRSLTLADGTDCVVSRDGSRIAVPWPVMPGTPIDMVDVLGSALRKAPVETMDAQFGYVAIYDDPASVEAIDPDMEVLASLARGTVIATAPGVESDIVLRAFAPKLGLPEDPVCGTAHRIIVPYWAERFGKVDLHSRQLSPRGGDLWCRLENDRVVIAGESVTFLTGYIELPN